MESITVRNFKSYEATTINGLHPRVNIFVGGNGQGKSNFFKAISFVLSDKVAINRNELLSYTHRKTSENDSSVEAEVVLHNPEHSILRVWNADLSEILKINGKLFSKKDYEEFLESLGFSFSNPYNIIQQGKITQVLHMDTFEVYSLLEDAIGIKKYQKKLNETIKVLKSIFDEKKNIESLMEDLDGRLKNIEFKKGEFELFSIGEIGKKVKQKKKFDESLASIKEKIEEFQKNICYNNHKISEIKKKKNILEEQTEDIEALLKVNLDRITYLENENPEKVLIKENILSKKELIIKLQTLSKNKEKELQKINLLNREVEKLNKNIEPLKYKYDLISVKIEVENGKEEKHKIKKKYEVEIKECEEKFVNIEREEKKLTKARSELKITKGELEQEEIINLEKYIKENELLIKINNIKQIEENRKKNQLDSEIEIFKIQKDACITKIKKIMPFLDLNFLAAIRRENIKGVYGYLIEFLEINPDVSFAFEITSLNKLCTLLVEDEITCNQVIALNRELKGRTINILALNKVRKSPLEKKSYPESKDVFPLIKEDWVKVKTGLSQDFTEALKKIVVNSFGKFVLVEDYETGLKISKEYYLTCITAEKEIVQSEGYLCKVGKEDNYEEKLSIFFKFVQKDSQYKNAIDEVQEINDRILGLQNERLNLVRKCKEHSEKYKMLQTKINENKLMNNSYERITMEEQKLIENKLNLMDEIKKKTHFLQNFDRNESKVNMEEFNRIEKEYKIERERLNKILKEKFNLEENIENILREEKELNTIIIENEEENVEIEIESSLIIAKLKEETKELKLKQNLYFEEKEFIEEEFYIFTEENRNIQSNLNLFEEEQFLLENKIKELKNITSEEIEFNEELSNSLSLNKTEEKSRHHHFTAKDKFLFAKFFTIHEEYKRHKEHYDNLNNMEKKLEMFIHEFELEKEKTTAEMIEKFKVEFANVFEKVVKEGKTDVRVKKILEEKQFKNALIIRVSFKENELKRWTEFSGGEKSVVAVCLLMAFQKLEPAPFYVFDEVDAALDWMYVEKIMGLIWEESRKSQYLITSFKPEIISMLGDISNCYVVESSKRTSQIRKVDAIEAQREIYSLTK